MPLYGTVPNPVLFPGSQCKAFDNESPSAADASIGVAIGPDPLGHYDFTAVVEYASAPASTDILIQQETPSGNWLTIAESKNTGGEIIADSGTSPRTIRALQNGSATGVTVTIQR